MRINTLKYYFMIFFLFALKHALEADVHEVKRIAIIVAMEDEANPIITKLHAENVDAQVFGFPVELGLKVYLSKIEGKEIFLIKNGIDPRFNVDRVGTQAATLTAATTIQCIKPDIIISAGTAGGVKNCKIGDVYISNSPFVYCDRVISVPNFKPYGEGHFDCFSIDVSNDFNLKKGKIATSNSFDATPRDLKILEELQADVVDMEATAIAETASRWGLKVIALKSVTNFLNANSHTDFDKNYKYAISQLADSVYNVVYYL